MSMSEIDLIDEYLTNRLDGASRAAFEQKIASDPQLKAEVDLQREIVESVKKARMAELKAMLNNVPIGGASNALIGKAALATISAGVIGTVLYFALPGDSQPTAMVQENVVEETTVSPEPVIEESKIEESETKEEKLNEADVPVVTPKQENTSRVKKMAKVKPALPKVDVMDLSQETENNQDTPALNTTPSSSPGVKASSVEVETDNTNKSYPFHYQFREGKLVLYGPFDGSLYEIIEINGGTHTLFLYYKDSYYHLDEKEHNIVPLIMIRDIELLDKLKKYRSQK